MPAGFALFYLAASLIPIDQAGFQKLVQSNKGSIVLYDFWATYCAPCRAEMPQLIQLERKLSGSGFKLVTISADEPEQLRQATQFIERAGITAPAYRKNAANDDAFINSIDRSWSGAMPALFLYDRNGRHVRSFIGETDIKTLEAAIRAQLRKR